MSAFLDWPQRSHVIDISYMFLQEEGNLHEISKNEVELFSSWTCESTENLKKP